MDAHVTDTPEPPRFAGWAARPAGGPGRDGPGPPHRRHWRRLAAVALAGFVLAGGGIGWAVYAKLNGNIQTDSATERELRKWESERPPAGPPNAENVLLIGSDSRKGGNGKYGHSRGQRSDTTMLLHLAADRKSATAVSIPRDLMVEVPHCLRADGTETEPRPDQFNAAFAAGGPACAIRTAEKLTGIRIDHYLIIDFVGFTKMVDAVDGVEVCLPRPVHDPEAHLTLPAGRQTLHGEDALGYVRARKSLGNGSDTQRMERQQRFLAALVKKVQSNGVLLNPTRLYPVLDAATSSLTTDTALASLKGLYELVRSTRRIPTDRIQFMTVPRQEYHLDPNRDELRQPDAGRLFAQLHSDLPVAVRPPQNAGEEPVRTGNGSSDGRPDSPSAPSPSSGPTFPGTTAERGICE
ncbi:LCP family protein [Streptomyces tubercidicus]|uniref:Transcriptional regulator n=1 Tax=Streptomyces tubercidicus TaxID=47759 RepID=A0A640UXJ9_9ACTN|nr:LCP family protein [Streptomyces tubercidicus]WAU13812.1 LCP family protein [Streptomyces tubercidicus]GFE39471.1 transcriptional regulator [Streptomyces tubercidicus]